MGMQSAEPISCTTETPLMPTAEEAWKQIWLLLHVLGIWSSAARGRYVTPVAPPFVFEMAARCSISMATPEKSTMGAKLTIGSEPGIVLRRMLNMFT